MTQKAIYTLILTLGGLMLALPLFGTSTTSSQPDTTIIAPFDVWPTNEGNLATWEGITFTSNEPGGNMNYNIL